jgi:hypothetical protein
MGNRSPQPQAANAGRPGNSQELPLRRVRVSVMGATQCSVAAGPELSLGASRVDPMPSDGGRRSKFEVE